MLHSVLVEKLNKYLWLQGLFCFLPMLFIAVYIFAYAKDVSSLASVITYNDSIVEGDYRDGIVKEVDGYTDNGDGTYNLVITGDSETEIEVALGDPIYYVYAISSEWYNLITADNSCSVHSAVCNFIDNPIDTEDGIQFEKDGKTYEVESNTLLASVLLDESGSYIIEYNNLDIEDETLDTLETLEVELATDTGYRFKFHSGYNLDIDDITVNFCSNLPTSNIYYNETSKTFIKNISDDFAKTFILGSNIAIVMISMLCYCILLYYIRKKGELILLKNKSPLYFNIVALLLLTFCIPVTLVLL